MKKIIILVTITVTALLQNGYSQQATMNEQMPSVVEAYLGVKDALVEGKMKTVTLQAEELLKAIDGVNDKTLDESIIASLKDQAIKLVKSKDIKAQRSVFEKLSNEMIIAVKAKLLNAPVYVQYCPMKKASWLSTEKSIKNPYYGSAMLSCGNVVETIK